MGTQPTFNAYNNTDFDYPICTSLFSHQFSHSSHKGGIVDPHPLACVCTMKIDVKKSVQVE